MSLLRYQNRVDPTMNMDELFQVYGSLKTPEAENPLDDECVRVVVTTNRI